MVVPKVAWRGTLSGCPRIIAEFASALAIIARMDFSLTRARGTTGKRLTFLAIAALHGLAVLLWPTWQRGRLPVHGDPATDIVFIAPLTAPTRLPAVRVQRVDKTAARAVPPRPAPTASVPQTAMVLIEPGTHAEASPLTEASSTALTAADIRERARKDMGKINHAVVDASLNLSVREFKFRATPLERAIDSAYAGNGNGFSVTDMVMPDGTRMTKVTKGKVVYCVSGGGGNGLTGGRDPVQQGANTKITNCPR